MANVSTYLVPSGHLSFILHLLTIKHSLLDCLRLSILYYSNETIRLVANRKI